MKSVFIFMLIFSFFSCSKKNEEKQPEVKPEVSQSVNSAVLSVSEAEKEFDREWKKIDPELLNLLRKNGSGTLHYKLPVLAENYHPNPDFQIQEPFFYLVPIETENGEIAGAIRMYAMKGSKKAGQIAEAVSYPQNFRYLAESELKTAVEEKMKTSFSGIQAKAVFIYDQNKNFWNLTGDWGWAVKTDESKGAAPQIFFLSARTRSAGINKNSSGEKYSDIQIYQISRNIFENDKRSSMDTDVKLLPIIH